MRTVNPPKREPNTKSKHNYMDKPVGTEAKTNQLAPTPQKQKQKNWRNKSSIKSQIIQNQTEGRKIEDWAEISWQVSGTTRATILKSLTKIIKNDLI